jgi:asparagine synthase (glutamine-hydrolysing)
MCGIAGFIHFDKERTADGRVLKQMTDSLHHRGPDGEGFFLEKNVALGHRRLAIIDMSTGQQPMFSDDGKIALVFNGEIYNYIELKAELETLGCVFHTTSDTEVIIQGYRTWGVDCQKHFNGMFAFALWDSSLSRLFVSRDRLGEKPLIYSQFDGTFIFGSEIKAVLAYGLPREANLSMTGLYLTLGCVPAPDTFYKNVNQLLPGHYLIADQSGIKINQYWALPSISEKDLSNDAARIEQEFESLFYDSVNIRMRSDVGFGAFLSGGLDSSSILGVMTKFAVKPVDTFTVGFADKEYDERGLARSVSEKFHSNHHEGTMSSASLEDSVKRILHHYDEPFGDPAAIPTGYVSEFAAKYVKMVLTGDGGDEVLSGYTAYMGENFAQKYNGYPSFVQKSLPRLVSSMSKVFTGGLRYKLNRVSKVLDASSLPFEERLTAKLGALSQHDIKRVFSSPGDFVPFADFYADKMKSCKFTDPFYKLMHFQLTTTLPDNMLTKVDRMSMAHSLETRIPFLDHRIVELLYGADKSIKMKGSLNKVILRNTIGNKLLPDGILNAKKKGFTVPLREWFKEDITGTFLNNNLLKGLDEKMFNVSHVAKMIGENKSGQRDNGTSIWIMLLLKSWMDGLDGKPADTKKAAFKVTGKLDIA